MKAKRKGTGKESPVKRVFDLIILFLIINEVAIYMYLRGSKSPEQSAPVAPVASPIPEDQPNSIPRTPEEQCALEDINNMKSLLQMTPRRTFIHPGGVPKVLCITLGGENSTTFKRVKLFMRVLGLDIEALEAVNGEQDLLDAKLGSNTRTNFNLPDYMKRTCKGISQEYYDEYKRIATKLFKRLGIKEPTIEDLMFAVGKYNDAQSKATNPLYIYHGNRHCFTGFLWSKLGCWQSHVLATREAERAGVTTIILEEDVDIDVEFSNIVRNALDDLPKNWDILRIGSCLDSMRMKRVKNSIYATDSQICNHGYILNGASGARSLLSIIDRKDPMEAFDTIMENEKITYTNFKSYTHVPYLVTQIEFRSFLKKKSVAGGIERSVGRALADILYLKECIECPNYMNLDRNYIISL